MIKAAIKQTIGSYKLGGLDLKAPEDKRDWKLEEFGGSLGKAPDKDFKVINIPEHKDQGNSDFCVGFQGSYTVEQDINNIFRLSPAFLFAATKKRYYGGDISGFGLAINKMLGTLQKDGICKEDLYPFTRSPSSRNKMANWKNIPSAAWTDAKKRKLDKGYFQVDLWHYMFDNFTSGMWHYKEIIVTGLYMFQGYHVDNKGRLITKKTGQQFGHCVGAVAKETIDGVPGIRFLNSYNRMPSFWLSKTQVGQEMFKGYIALPVARNSVEIIKKYAGKVVMDDNTESPKGFKNPNVYIIRKGLKCRLVNERSAYAHNVRLREDVLKIPASDLAVIPEGDPLDWEDGELYPLMHKIFSMPVETFKEFKI